MANISSSSETVFVDSRFQKLSQVNYGIFIRIIEYQLKLLFNRFQVTLEFIHAPEQIIWDPL